MRFTVVCRALVALAAAMWALPCAGWTQGDAGIRSVFATGAGNRALALGGAYTAVADDASAALWNPGGLGLVPRRTLAASYASMFLGFSEQYASFVFPNWRLGTFGVAFQQFSVDGIEVRDERNFLIGRDESEGQTQFSFAYGRRVGADWSVGAAVKLRRHSLAGFSDTGFGVDAGVLLHPARALGVRGAWADRMVAGVTLQNVLEPTIRLDQASVPDPPTARLGVSYWLPIRTRNVLLVATDLEKTSDMDTRIHVGVEARLRGTLALRAGYDGLKTTAGTGIRWRDVSFDYAYENNRLEDVHRVGASFRYGMSVEESRLAAQRAVEAAIETRLAEEFERRQAEQISALVARVETARDERRYDEALELVGTARVLAPQEDRLTGLEAACHREHAQQLEEQGHFAEAALAYRDALAVRPGDSVAAAGEARCRNLSDRSAERSQEIGERFARAFDAFSAEDFTAARRGFVEILELSPGDSEAARMLERTQAAIQRRTAAHLQLAERLLHDGVLEEAENLVDRTRQLDPNARGLDALERRIQAAQRERLGASGANGDSRKTAGAHASRSDSPERRAEIEDLYQRGLAALQDGRGREAVRYWELVWSFDPDYERVREHLRREYTTQGMELFARGNLNDAIQQWQNALRVDPSDPRALAYLSRAQEQLARTRQILGEGD